MANTWVVLLEAASRDAVGAIDRDHVGALLARIDGGPYAAALHSPGRYALQVTATATDPAEALRGILARWADAVRALGLPAWDMVRTEVFTPEELDCDIENEGEATTVPPARENRGGADPGRELLRQAFSDPLTGLLTMEIFEHRLRAALTSADTDGRAAILCLDLDRFATADPRFCGVIGDHILLAVAQRLAQALRGADVLARTGADEYAVLLEDANEEQVAAVAARLLESVRLPITVHGEQFRVSASVGSAVGQPGDDAQSVLSSAIAAQAAARAAGGDRHVAFGTGMVPFTTTDPVLRTDALQDRLAHLLIMQEAAVAANQADTLEQAATVVMRQVCAHVGCAVGRLWISMPGGSGALLPSIWHVADPDAHRALQQTSDDVAPVPDLGLPGEVVASGGPVWSAELAGRPPSLALGRWLAAGFRSAFAFPILVGSEMVAVLEFFSRRPVGSTTSFLGLLTSIGSQLGRVVERQRAAAAVRRSEEQLRQSEARLREAQAMARLGSWQYDLVTGESSWSDEMFALFGFDPGPVPDLGSALATVHPADRARAESALSALMESDDRTAVELRVVRGDGEIRWHCVEASVVRYGDGAAVAIHGTSQDITERKLAEIALRQREAQLDEAQRLARLGSWELDLSTRRTTLSDHMYRLWGWEPGRAISFEEFLATVVAEDRERVRANADRVLETGESGTLEYRAYTAQGQQRWFRGRAQLHCDEHGNPVKVSGTEQDITEEKQAEDELRTAKDLYQRILETTCEGIWTIDAQGVTTFANPRIAEMLGYAPEEMVGRPVTAFLDDVADRLGGSRRHPARAGISKQFETSLRTKGGDLVAALISTTPLLAKDGRWGTLAMVTELTALREAESVLRAHRQVAPEGEGAPDRPTVP